MLSKEQHKANLEILLDLFQHPGWALYKADIKILQDFGSDNAVAACDTNEKWQEWRGRSRAYTFMDRYDAMIQATLDAIDVNDDDMTNSLED